ncbi:conserved hypothetical protein [Ricinus communis]|uniref:Endonuclease/exonuclease/phosphatase domain-containing protein n=1 Tax=Ricinus communis TaxID=3988 RepID=B9STS6_RICCO|nr:conserved hypothetical protein [Ricinus communis]
MGVYTAIYDSPRPSVRKILWNTIRSISNTVTDPWILTSDFNSYLSINDKAGGRPASLSKCRDFRECMNDCNLEDLSFTGPKYTWERSGVRET